MTDIQHEKIRTFNSKNDAALCSQLITVVRKGSWLSMTFLFMGIHYRLPEYVVALATPMDACLQITVFERIGNHGGNFRQTALPGV